ncbi:hypothetical protein KIH74_17650 [Kineosporia sp. J2-2]|uniref:TetR family transcriptional regulator n=1 Tax=Kineosporia corallincola TaxID=2835133 RepID=A0ABS5TI61_9ACTN|nr:hypothetical protein [Kineosporia corallincola]MBT0770772.1 hypothetical protein [Kineosporia corallincola]
MHIDPAAEDLGREAIRTAIAQDQDGFLASLESMAQAEPILREQVLPIYSAVGRAALLTVYSDGPPNQQQNLDMARQIKEEEPWTPLTVRELWEILEGLSLDEHVPQMAAERLPTALFVVTGYLLSTYAQGQGFGNFYEYLDAILDELVRKPV